MEKQERILWLKLGGIGDIIDSGMMLGGVRKKHPNAVITAIVRQASHVKLLQGIYLKETGQPVCDFVRPASHRVSFWRWRREIPLSWQEAWQSETGHADWDYAYDARPYIGKVYRFKQGIPSIVFPRVTNAEDEASYNNPTSLWTHKLASRNQTTIELMNRSMDLHASWDEVDIERVPIKLELPEDFVILSNATDTGKKQNTKQWLFDRFDKLAKTLDKNGLQPVQLGTKKDELIANCLDLRGKTSLLEAVEIVRQAKLVITIEGGLARLAGLVNTPSIVVFTSTPVSLFRVPCSTPILQQACALENGCFWRTGEWMTDCMLEKTLKFKNNESLPICAASIEIDNILSKVNEVLSCGV